MLDTVAAIFGMGVDEVVKLIVAVSAAVTTIAGAVTKILITLHGARKRSFVKIRRIEDILLAAELKRIDGGALSGAYLEMREDQRDAADERDLG